MIPSNAILALGVLATGLYGPAAYAQEGRDACVERLRAEGGPDAQNGVEVLESLWSEAGTLVTMRDAGGSVWECLGYDDGTTEYLEVADAADDGEGAMEVNTAREGPENDGDSTTERVQFAKGASGATYDGTLTPGSNVNYVLGAQSGQFLSVHVVADGAGVAYQIFNPDKSFLLDMTEPDKDYRGQLFQSGDHVVELYNRGDGAASYRVEFGIE